VEWPAKRCYVGLVAVGVQEQAEDILVPPLLGQAGLSSRVVSASDCGVRGSRFESRR